MFANTNPSGNLFGSTAPGQPTNTAFGATPSAQPQPISSAFGTLQQPTTLGVGTNAFGGQFGQQNANNLYGSAPSRAQQEQLERLQQQQLLQQQQNQQQSQQQGPTNFFGGGLGAPNPALGQSINAFGQTQTANNAFGLQQPLPVLGQSLVPGQQNIHRLGQSNNQLWMPNPGPREKSIPEQMQILAEKWAPDSADCVFQHYFYNQVPPQHVPFYVPDPSEDSRLWEEALSKKPTAGSIPVLAKGFYAVGQRIEVQHHVVRHLQQRLHEINNSLDQIIQKQNVDFSARVAEARRRHLAICQRTISIATKVQTLRNRGYSLDASEEELKKRLSNLERASFDPAITGRQDEIWARMAGLRARAQVIKEESDRRGNGLSDMDKTVLNEEASKEITKLLKNYDTQLKHLQNELGSIGKEYKDWLGPTQNSS